MQLTCDLCLHCTMTVDTLGVLHLLITALTLMRKRKTSVSGVAYGSGYLDSGNMKLDTSDYD